MDAGTAISPLSAISAGNVVVTAMLPTLKRGCHYDAAFALLM